jgi:hypothetical protein
MPQNRHPAGRPGPSGRPPRTAEAATHHDGVETAAQVHHQRLPNRPAANGMPTSRRSRSARGRSLLRGLLGSGVEQRQVGLQLVNNMISQDLAADEDPQGSSASTKPTTSTR